MKSTIELIQDKVHEISKQHAAIIERECQLACTTYNCKQEDLIIEHHNSMEIKIMIQASHFVINNQFVFNDKQIRNAMHHHEDK